MFFHIGSLAHCLIKINIILINYHHLRKLRPGKEIRLFLFTAEETEDVADLADWDPGPDDDLADTDRENETEGSL